MAETPNEQGGEHSQENLNEQRRLAEQQERIERMRLTRERYRLERERELSQFERKVEEEKKPSFDHLEHTDKSRKHIAYVFVYGYMITVAVIIIGVPLYNAIALHMPSNLELDKILAQVGALIGAPLGFVVGYYFKEDAGR
jgi:hypothetical protein